MKTTSLETLAALGFVSEDTAGGCNWLRKPIGGKLALCISDQESNAPIMDTDACTLFLMSEEHGDPVMERQFDSVTACAEFLRLSL